MFSKAILVGALAALAAAQSTVISFTNALPAPARVGTPFELTYKTTDASTPVTILLRKGNSDDLKTVSTLTSAASGGSYSWTPASDLEDDDDYALEIQQGAEVNYLGPFSIEGGSGTGATPSSSSATPSSSSAATYDESSSSKTLIASSTITAAAPYGTGNATIPRNTTLSSVTLTRTSNPTSTSASGAGFQGTDTAAQSTGGAATLMAGSSAVALVLGAVAALVMA